MTYVQQAIIENDTVESPRWEDVERAIQSLDGLDLTLVVIAPSSPLGAPEGEHHMAIGGGKDGRFVVYTTDDNEKFWSLENPSGSNSDIVMMNVGGQEGDYREAQCVPMQWALQAARAYFDEGRRAEGLRWVET